MHKETCKLIAVITLNRRFSDDKRKCCTIFIYTVKQQVISIQDSTHIVVLLQLVHVHVPDLMIYRSFMQIKLRFTIIKSAITIFRLLQAAMVIIKLFSLL